MKKVLLILVAAVLVLIGVVCVVYATRFRSMASIEKLTSYDSEYNLYRMDVLYDYDLDKVIGTGATDNQKYIDAILAEALPLLPIHM